ncbi:hypothetical protein INR49_018568 [Caranx melampygus]|nr:hypothetical protein INR49_018568 [Caranx melampygus]
MLGLNPEQSLWFCSSPGSVLVKKDHILIIELDPPPAGEVEIYSSPQLYPSAGTVSGVMGALSKAISQVSGWSKKPEKVLLASGPAYMPLVTSSFT